ncbi:MAG: RDD family protein, partial [Anaerolineales bacterium]
IDLYTCAANPDRIFLLYSCKFISASLVVFTIIFPILYTIFFWTLAGQTPGKALFGLRVVRINGKRMSIIACIVRYIGYAICVISLGLGFLNVLINDRRQGWHDRLARTCVIYAWEARQNEALLDRVRYRLDHLRTKNT